MAVTQVTDTGPTVSDPHPDGRPDGHAQDGRLLWRCRRGMKELDVLLERFARQALPGASADERRVFAELLELSDPTLAGYLLGGEEPPPGPLVGLVSRIRA
jgi:antitoxin CptB